MRRLIDADKAYKELIEVIDWIRDQDYGAYSAVGDDIRMVLDDHPTAFDVGKVVESLTNRFRIVSNDEDLEWNRAMDCAVKIVKGGGVE